MDEYKKQYNTMLKENIAMRYLFKLQRDALNNYYHEIHRCQCKIGKECESPWVDKLGRKNANASNSPDYVSTD